MEGLSCHEQRDMLKRTEGEPKVPPVVLVIVILLSAVLSAPLACPPDAIVEDASASPGDAEAVMTHEDVSKEHPDASDLSAVVGMPVDDGQGHVESAAVLDGRVTFRHGSLSVDGREPRGLNRSFAMVSIELAEECTVELDGGVAQIGDEVHVLTEDGRALAIWSEDVE